MICPNCGYSNQANNRFCVRCGIDIASPPGQANPASGPPPGAPTPNPWGGPPQPPAPQTAPGQAPPPPQPSYPPPPYAPAPAYGAPGPYPGPYAPSGFPPISTNGLAIASLVLGIVGWSLCGIGSIVAIVLGFVGRNQIRDSGGRQSGDGLALAGIILGFVGLALIILFFVVAVAAGSGSSQS
ncbi:MAG TPA: DUF4190 domain-containing protein [Acidimicrobiia bacterium]|jgi:hypothetical protein|nr:DUF4190 domain-containing protein [Acidimicrobiia bacterium]